MWILNYTFINNLWIKKETRKEFRKYLELNENEKTTYQNLSDAAKSNG